MRTITLLIVSFFFFSITFCREKEPFRFAIANGRMPNITRDKSNNIHIVYGSGDSIMYASSKTGKSFSTSSVVAVLPGLFASAMRGPQIAATPGGIIVTACTKNGNIFSYRKETAGKWSKPTKVNDADETAKEALMGISADGNNAYVVWLGAKQPKGQDVFGARSVDGGKTWSKNILVYASPESTVCECCKPSVLVKGNKVYIMFRNFLHGNRDMYLATSVNGGSSFVQAQKLGTGNWKLNGCPMDGGGLALDNNGNPETVWRREGKIYASAQGQPEKEIGEGRACTIETVNGKKVYAWTEKGDVIVMKPGSAKTNLGKGSLPLIKALGSDRVLCVWENEQQIRGAVVEL